MSTATAAAPARPLSHEIVRRTWPLFSGLFLCLFFALAEIQNWTPFVGRPYSPGVGHWLVSRFAAPVGWFASDPLAAWPFVPLVFAVTRHLYRPRWWNAPLMAGGMMVWVMWGSSILGRTA